MKTKRTLDDENEFYDDIYRYVNSRVNYNNRIKINWLYHNSNRIMVDYFNPVTGRVVLNYVISHHVYHEVCDIINIVNSPARDVVWFDLIVNSIRSKREVNAESGCDIVDGDIVVNPGGEYLLCHGKGIVSPSLYDKYFLFDPKTFKVAGIHSPTTSLSLTTVSNIDPKVKKVEIEEMLGEL